MTNQTVTLQAATGNNFNNLPPVNPPIATFTAGYQWDDEGRMTSMQSPLTMLSGETFCRFVNVIVCSPFRVRVYSRTAEDKGNGAH